MSAEGVVFVGDHKRKVLEKEGVCKEIQGSWAFKPPMLKVRMEADGRQTIIFITFLEHSAVVHLI